MGRVPARAARGLIAPRTVFLPDDQTRHLTLLVVGVSNGTGTNCDTRRVSNRTRPRLRQKRLKLYLSPFEAGPYLRLPVKRKNGRHDHSRRRLQTCYLSALSDCVGASKR